MTAHNYVSNHSGISSKQVQNTINLFDEGATIPFIARYRKEATGQLDEVEIQTIKEHYEKYQEILKRKEYVLGNIAEQGKLTDELRQKIEDSFVLQEIEDLYLPYKSKKKKRSTIAIEKGLEPLAQIIFDGQAKDPQSKAEEYLTEQVETIEDALQGARDIMAEWVSENIEARNKIRNVFERGGMITSKVKKNKETDGAKYRDYFDFSESLSKIPSHRLLAIRRGEEEGFLSIDISPDEETALEMLDRIFLKGYPESKDQIEKAITDSYKRLMKPSIETEFSNISKEKADKYAIQIFAENLRQLLLASPLGQKRVLAIDPGFRTGCKVVCLDENGTLIKDTVIYPFENKSIEAEGITKKLLIDYKIEAIAIGNGTAGRESEEFVRKITANMSSKYDIFMVSEQGASIYSASDVARKEFPDKDVTVRGAISIGRRLMDPLAELVKISPKSIGVGQYQHDVDQNMLKTSLDTVVESCVNLVGVNLNTASEHILSYISGLGPSLSKNIVEYRAKNGDFKSRHDLLKVPRLGGKAFEQCAGFLRIPNGKNPLDNSAVHPERYPLVERMAKDLSTNIPELMKNAQLRKTINIKKYVSAEVGEFTLNDILKELEKPSLDPRKGAEAFAFDPYVKTIEDLREGMILPGIVTNITAFGAFVDVGVKQDGLVHVSQMSNKFIKDPNEVVKLQQIVQVKITEVDFARKRIALTMKL